MRPLRLAVIGTGLAWHRLHYPAIQELSDKYQVVAVCDKDRKKVEQAARQLGIQKGGIYTDYREMLNRSDIDVVDVAVPISDNFQVSLDVAKAGKDIICEKPLAPDLKQAKRFLDLPKRFDVKVMIAENYRYNEENNIIRDLVRQGRIGDIVYFIRNDVACFPCLMTGDTFAQTEWRQHPEYAGGTFTDAALHDIAAVRHIFGAVDQVQAFGVPQKEDFSPYRSFHVNMMFKNGVIGQFSYWPNGKELQRPLIGTRVFGTKGMIYLEERRCGIINVFNSDGSSEQIAYRPERGYYNEFLNFFNAVAGAETVSVTPDMEYGDLKMVMKILESMRREGQRMNVDDTVEFNVERQPVKV